MSQSATQIHINKPVAPRSPSPDIITSHMLVKTKPLEIKTPDKRHQKIPLVQQINNLTKENRKLKELLQNGQSEALIRELEEKNQEITELRNQLSGERVNRRLFVTLNDPTHNSLRNSTQRRRKSVSHEESKEELLNLRKKVYDLEKDNEELKKTLLSRSIRVSSDNQNARFSEFKYENDGPEKIAQIQRESGAIIARLEEKIAELQKELRKEEQEPRSSQKISLVTTLKRGLSSKNQSRYNSPNKQQTQANLQTQLTVSKNNVIQLQRQNESLQQENANIRKAYEELLKKSHHSVASNRPMQYTFETQSQLNRMIMENQSLKDTLQGLRNNLDLLHEQNHHLRIQVSTFDEKKDGSTINRLSGSIQGESKQDAKQKERITELERNNTLLTKQKDVLKTQLFSINSNNQKYNTQIKNLEEENSRLQEENSLLRGNIAQLLAQISSNQQIVKGNSRLEEIWNELTNSKKRIEELQLKNRQLENQLLMKTQPSSLLQGKDIQISKLKDELNKALSEQRKVSSSEADNLRRQLTILQERLHEADKIVEKSNGNDLNNKREVSAMLRSLQELKRMLDRITFQSLEVSLRQIGFKYKTVIEDRIQIFKKLKEKSNENLKNSTENQRLKHEIVQINTKYINQKSQRQQLQSYLQQQGEEVKVLKEQVKELNRVLVSYINEKIEQRVEESRVTQLETEIIDQTTERNITQLKELESQVNQVSNRLEIIIKKVKICVIQVNHDGRVTQY